jgi:hypothetical protein
VLDPDGDLYQGFVDLLTHIKLGSPTNLPHGASAFSGSLIQKIIRSPSASGCCIHSVLALLPLDHTQRDCPKINLSDAVLKKASVSVLSGHTGPILLKNQFEKFHYRQLSPTQLTMFEGFMRSSLGEGSWLKVASALVPLAQTALSKAGKKKLKIDVKKWNGDENGEATTDFFMSHPAWLVPILRHPRAHGIYDIEQAVSEAVGTSGPSWTVAQIATALTQARPV